MDVGLEEGAIENDEFEMITNVFSLDDSLAKDIMIPRIDMSFLHVDATYDEVIELYRETSYTRFPIYSETRDTIIGTINVKDLLLYPKDEPFHIRKLLREPHFTFEHKEVGTLLMEMQEGGISLVIVLDEYGATSGMITMEDILEEIVGNILDEYDEEDEMIQKQNDGSMIANGLKELEDLEDLIPVTFDKEDYETLNGFLIDELEHIPGEDEKCVVDYEGYRFTALQVDNNIIQTVKIEKLPEA